MERSVKPIFIGGCERSGTTLLGAMLGGHKECLCIPESSFKVKVIQRIRGQGEEKNDIKNALEMIKGYGRFKLWGLEIEDDAFIKGINSYSELISYLVKKYGEKTKKTAFKIWVDHTPTNLRYAAELIDLFPEAKMIHIIRDGRGVASSVMRMDWGPNTVNRAANWWMEKVGYGLTAESFLKNGRVIRVKYEDIVTNPETAMKKLCSFLEIEYYPEMIEGKGFDIPEHSSGTHALIGKKPDRNRANAWEKELSPRQVEIFESLASEMLKFLGYDLKYGFKATGMTKRERVMFFLRHKYKVMTNLLHFKYRLRRGISAAKNRSTGDR